MGDRISLLNQNITTMNCRRQKPVSTTSGAQTKQEADEKLKTNKYVQVYLKRVIHSS
jgi:hypothetical protein